LGHDIAALQKSFTWPWGHCKVLGVVDDNIAVDGLIARIVAPDIAAIRERSWLTRCTQLQFYPVQSRSFCLVLRVRPSDANF